MSRRKKSAFKDPEWDIERRGRKASERAELTDEIVAEAVAVRRERSIHDASMRGLFVRIRPSGAKTYCYRQPGIRSKQAVTLGNAETQSIAAARAAASRIKIERAEGRMSRVFIGGPNKKTVAQSFDTYISEKPKSQWSVRIEKTFRDLILPKIGDIEINKLTGDQAAEIFDHLEGYYVKGTPAYILSAFLTWAYSKGLVRYNVLRGRVKLPWRPRARSFSPSGAEIGAFWRACAVLPTNWAIAFRLMIASGRSIDEILSLTRERAWHEWPEADDYMSGRRSELVKQLLGSMGHDGGRFLFVARGKRTPMVFQQRHWNRLRDAAGHSRATMRGMRESVEREFAMRRGDLAKWDEFLQSCMTEPECIEEVDL